MLPWLRLSSGSAAVATASDLPLDNRPELARTLAAGVFHLFAP
jgi:hypothetical protein